MFSAKFPQITRIQCFVAKSNSFVARIYKDNVFVVKIYKHNVFVAKICKCTLRKLWLDFLQCMKGFQLLPPCSQVGWEVDFWWIPAINFPNSCTCLWLAPWSPPPTPPTKVPKKIKVKLNGPVHTFAGDPKDQQVSEKRHELEKALKIVKNNRSRKRESAGKCWYQSFNCLACLFMKFMSSHEPH